MRLGEVTRNAVIGKVHRLGLAGRATISRIKKVQRAGSVVLFPARPSRSRQLTFGAASHSGAANHADNRSAVPAVRLRQRPELGVAPEGVIGIAELQDGMCHWPVGDPKEQGFHFCGRCKFGRIPYCEHHAAIAYMPAARCRR